MLGRSGVWCVWCLVCLVLGLALVLKGACRGRSLRLLGAEIRGQERLTSVCLAV